MPPIHLGLAESRDSNFSNTRASKPDEISGSFTEINRPTIRVGSSIINPHNNTTSEADLESGTKRKCFVSCS